jgi:hypothetical protein
MFLLHFCNKKDFFSEDKKELYKYLNKNKTTELHTHLMGMGDANFWINDILIEFLYKNNLEFLLMTFLLRLLLVKKLKMKKFLQVIQ